MNPQTPDPKVKALVSAMGEVESGPSSPDAYKRRGASGEFGRYQFMPKTWSEWSKEAGIATPLEQSSIEEQNKVAYYKVKQWKDQGLTPAQIASKWNSGDPDAYKRNHVGVNSQGVRYDTPSHVRKVSEAYLRKSGQLGGSYTPPPAPKPFEAPASTGLENLQANLGAKPEGFTGQIAQNLKDVGTGINQASTKSLTGEINPASGVLQGAGSVAGGVGSLIDTAISNVPVVGDAYNFISDKVVGPAVSAVGEATGATAAFNKLSPEAQGNIGATGNLLSLIPFLRAFKTGKQGLQDTLTKTREGSIKKDAVGELEQSLGNSQLASNLKKDGAIPRLVDRDALPEVVEVGKDTFAFNVDKALDKIDQQMKDVIERQNEAAKSQPSTYRPNELAGYAKLGTDTKITAPVQDSLEALQKHYTSTYDSNGQLWLQQMTKKLNDGEITVADINDVARKIGQAKSSYLQSGDISSSIPKQAWENLRRDLKNVVGERDVTGQMRSLDKDYSRLATERKALMKLQGKKVPLPKEGLVKSVLREVPGSRFLMPKTPSSATMRLTRRRPLRETGARGLKQVGVGQALSNQLGKEEEQRNI